MMRGPTYDDGYITRKMSSLHGPTFAPPGGVGSYGRPPMGGYMQDPYGYDYIPRDTYTPYTTSSTLSSTLIPDSITSDYREVSPIRSTGYRPSAATQLILNRVALRNSPRSSLPPMGRVHVSPPQYSLHLPSLPVRRILRRVGRQVAFGGGYPPMGPPPRMVPRMGPPPPSYYDYDYGYGGGYGGYGGYGYGYPPPPPRMSRYDTYLDEDLPEHTYTPRHRSRMPDSLNDMDMRDKIVSSTTTTTSTTTPTKVTSYNRSKSPTCGAPAHHHHHHQALVPMPPPSVAALRDLPPMSVNDVDDSYLEQPRRLRKAHLQSSPGIEPPAHLHVPGETEGDRHLAKLQARYPSLSEPQMLQDHVDNMRIRLKSIAFSLDPSGPVPEIIVPERRKAGAAAADGDKAYSKGPRHFACVEFAGGQPLWRRRARARYPSDDPESVTRTTEETIKNQEEKPEKDKEKLILRDRLSNRIHQFFNETMTADQFGKYLKNYRNPENKPPPLKHYWKPKQYNPDDFKVPSDTSSRYDKLAGAKWEEPDTVFGSPAPDKKPFSKVETGSSFFSTYGYTARKKDYVAEKVRDYYYFGDEAKPLTDGTSEESDDKKERRKKKKSKEREFPETPAIESSTTAALASTAAPTSELSTSEVESAAKEASSITEDMDEKELKKLEKKKRKAEREAAAKAAMEAELAALAAAEAELARLEAESSTLKTDSPAPAPVEVPAKVEAPSPAPAAAEEHTPTPAPAEPATEVKSESAADKCESSTEVVCEGVSVTPESLGELPPSESPLQVPPQDEQIPVEVEEPPKMKEEPHVEIPEEVPQVESQTEVPQVESQQPEVFQEEYQAEIPQVESHAEEPPKEPLVEDVQLETAPEEAIEEQPQAEPQVEQPQPELQVECHVDEIQGETRYTTTYVGPQAEPQVDEPSVAPQVEEVPPAIVDDAGAVVEEENVKEPECEVPAGGDFWSQMAPADGSADDLGTEAEAVAEEDHLPTAALDTEGDEALGEEEPPPQQEGPTTTSHEADDVIITPASATAAAATADAAVAATIAANAAVANRSEDLLE
ncbi:titin-like isoform X6 [Macrobrachium nipponense]|uniref:titin-like isoform X6 n=1 Tax=Macrobrachium nipponense TaxID=159736 RepID=UPI0030C86A7E